MTVKETVHAFLSLADVLDERDNELNDTVNNAYLHNKWFTPANIFLAFENIRKEFLDKEKLESWYSAYPVDNSRQPKTVGIVMAGNIPLVGFHDFLSVLVSGNKALMKLSSKDEVLFPYLLQKLFEAEPRLRQHILVTEILKGMDAVIATGSNNSARYFDYYFGKYPHLIRRNRNSVAVITGTESKDDLMKLGTDIFSFFGLGCRNVSKLMVPTGYSFDLLFESVESFSYLNEHNKYKNNYDYNRAVFLLNKEHYLANDFLILKENEQLASPVTVLHYEFYEGDDDLKQKLERDKEQIQCVVGAGFIPFGKSQSPELDDYADHVDTMKFLVELR